MTAVQFIASVLGKVVQAPMGVGAQCVDLANLYVLQVWRAPEQHLNAIDWRNAAIPGCCWTANGAENYPPLGALVIWGPSVQVNTGTYGHIAVSIGADAAALVTCDQNWPDGAPVSLVCHSYAGVLGWLSR